MNPQREGYYWVYSETSGWEIAFWGVLEFNTSLWWVFGKEYGLSAKELGITDWEGPLVRVFK